MNQTALITTVAERAGLTKTDVGKAVGALVGTITDALNRMLNRPQIRNFRRWQKFLSGH